MTISGKKKILMFQGHSDDTFGELTTRNDYDNCADRSPIVFRVSLDNDSFQVVGMYAPDNTTGPTWCVGIQQSGENVPIPTWAHAWYESTHPYSVRLCVAVPAEAEVTCLNREAKKEMA